MIDWTEERIGVLRQMWMVHGCAASEIAAALGDGISRNAVIGKLGRLGLLGSSAKPVQKAAVVARSRAGNKGQPRAQAAAERVRRRQAHAETLRERQDAFEADGVALLKTAAWAPLPGTTPVSLLDLGRDQCRWPIGEVGAPGFGYCGAPAREGGPYCAHHHARAHTAPVPAPFSPFRDHADRPRATARQMRT